jgi:APA family basic amino acid/polyamine antiporter
MSATAAPTPAQARGLLRVLGSAFGLAIVIGATIGGGILRTPGDVATQLPALWLFMAAWAFGGLNALLGATAYAELGAMIPRSGGIYTFAHRAMGDTVGFFVGFADWLNWCIASAALILLIGEYLSAFLPALTGQTTLAGFLVFGVMVAMQWRGVIWSARMQEVTSVLKTLAFAGLILAAFVLPHSPIAPSDAPPPVPEGVALLAAAAIALQGIVFTYDSYYTVVYCGEELRSPGVEIPRSIFRGLIFIIAIYLLVNAAYASIVPIDRMAGDSFVGATVARSLFGVRGDAVIRAVMIVSIIGTANAFMIAAPRILLAMSRDGLFPTQAGAVNEGGTPSIATILSVLMIAGFLFSGSFSAAVGVDAIIILVGYVMVFTSLFVLRRREPQTPRPYRAWGYPVVPGLALLFAVVILGTLAVVDRKSSLITAALILASWPASRLVKRWTAAHP